MMGLIAAVTTVRFLSTREILFRAGVSKEISVLSYVCSDSLPGLQVGLEPEIVLASGSEVFFPSQEATVSEPVLPDAAMFSILVKQWHAERGATSSIVQMAVCPSYRQIMAMSDAAIPLIFRSLEQEGEEPDMWFVALQTLTRADPVTDDIRGDFKAMADRWLAWGRARGYVW